CMDDNVMRLEDALRSCNVSQVSVIESVDVLGNNLRDAHINYLFESKQVVVMPDGVDAGRVAMRTWGRDLRGLGKTPEYVEVPKGKDPKNLTYKELRDMLWTYS